MRAFGHDLNHVARDFDIAGPAKPYDGLEHVSFGFVFTSDHGDFLGDHGLYWKSVVTFDEAMHVPLIISYPRMIPKGKRCKAFQKDTK